MNRMTLITMTALVALTVYNSFELRESEDSLDRIQKEMDDLRDAVHKISERDNDAQTVETPSQKVLPLPVRDPNADVTGASARIVARTARQSSCKSNCEQVIKCFASSPVCPGWRTDSDVPAMKACLTSCRRQDEVKRQLASLTDCSGITRFTDHSMFQGICQ